MKTNYKSMLSLLITVFTFVSILAGESLQAQEGDGISSDFSQTSSSDSDLGYDDQSSYGDTSLADIPQDFAVESQDPDQLLPSDQTTYSANDAYEQYPTETYESSDF